MEDGWLQVEMESGSTVRLDMHRRLQSVRFGLLRNQEVFRSVATDGYRLIFYQNGIEVLEIPADTFMDLLAVDRTR
jgi:two-component system chemotaxis response regulator CheY